ncbi:MAG: type II toxin-antitoxin system RelE/ParE family toxin [Gammaproteobacteria bacterium]|nr:type II toxin-antitoxin system RelE/ParE family toxin [Gammaproteobacteria bacterium]
MADGALKPVEWLGSSKEDLRGFPGPVQDRIGFAVYQAQIGSKHRDAKPLTGLGSGVIEVAARHDGDTYRAIYTVQFQAAVYVLHAFKKKAKRGIKTPKPEIDLIRHRLKVAKRHYRDVYERGG